MWEHSSRTASFSDKRMSFPLQVEWSTPVRTGGVFFNFFRRSRAQPRTPSFVALLNKPGCHSVVRSLSRLVVGCLFRGPKLCDVYCWCSISFIALYLHNWKMVWLALDNTCPEVYYVLSQSAQKKCLAVTSGIWLSFLLLRFVNFKAYQGLSEYQNIVCARWNLQVTTALLGDVNCLSSIASRMLE